MRITVIGGTGLIGTMLVTELRARGHEVVAASPDSGVNTLTGAGLSDALHGSAVVVDVSNTRSVDDAAVMEFFSTSTRNLLTYAKQAGVSHYVALSVVGVAGLLGSAYFRAKHAQESLIKEGRIPYSIVHATQFFEFVDRIADQATDGTIVRLPAVLIQPMAACEVADAIAMIATGGPLNGTLDLAGPEEFRLDQLIRVALAARHDPRQVLIDPHARYFGTELGERSLIPAADARLGRMSYQQWLAGKLSTRKHLATR